MLSDLLDLLLPRECIACDEVLAESERHICLTCLATLPQIEQAHHPVANAAGIKLGGRLPLVVGTALWNFLDEGKVQTLVHRLKYGDRQAGCIYVGRLLGHHIVDLAPPTLPDAVTFVPMHPRKERSRGYNQARLLAEGVAQILALPVLDLLRKTTYTQSQTRLGRRHRWANLDGAFASKDVKGHSPSLAGKHILLVDDVLTTGATLERTAEPLLAEGASHISFAVVASAE